MIYSEKELQRREKPWQMERGERYGNRRKEVARLKWKERKRDRRNFKEFILDIE